jgi:hypothetical protein
MRAILSEAARPAPIPFPWTRFAVGLAAGVVLCGLVARHGPELVDLL